MAERIREWVDYDVDGRTHRGCLIHAPGVTPRALVLIVPNWLGINDNSLAKAERCLDESHILFVADVYGHQHWPKDSAEAGALVRGLYADRPMLRARLAAALAAARQAAARVSGEAIPPARTAAVGFCFGGAAVLELARDGADLAAAVSVHGTLAPPLPAPPSRLRAAVLVLHGDADPSVPVEQVRAFEEEMRAAQADWQLVSYGGVVHSFTNPLAKVPGRGLYSERATRDAFRTLRGFLADRFADAQ